MGRADASPRDDHPEGPRLFDQVDGPLHQAGPGEGEGRDVGAALQGVLERHRRSHHPPADVRRRVHDGRGRGSDRRAGVPLRRGQRGRDAGALHGLLRRHAPRRSEVREGEEGRGGAGPRGHRQPDRLPAHVAQAGHREERVEDAAEVGAAQEGRRRRRVRRDQADRQGRGIRRGCARRRFLVGDGAGQGLHAEGRQRRQPPVRHRPGSLQEAEVRRARHLLSPAQRHPDRDAVRGRQAVDASRRPRERQGQRSGRRSRPTPATRRSPV